MPLRGALLSGDQKDNRGLSGIGVLEFIHKDVPIALAERNTNRLVFGHELMRSKQKIVKIQRCGLALTPRVSRDGVVKRVGQAADQAIGDLPE